MGHLFILVSQNNQISHKEFSKVKNLISSFLIKFSNFSHFQMEQVLKACYGLLSNDHFWGTEWSFLGHRKDVKKGWGFIHEPKGDINLII